jgi:DNA-binding CsgD family transcriptional regulator
MKTYHAESARAGLEAAADAGLRWDEFATVAAELLERAIPYDGMCMGIADPATQLATGRVKVNLDSADDARFLQYEYLRPDLNHFTDLARRPVAVSILAEAIERTEFRSPRKHEYLADFEIEHEVRAAVRSGGRMWGVYAIYRSAGQTGFSPAERQYLHRLEQTIALGLRRGLIASSIEPAGRASPAADVIIFDGAGQVASATPAAEARIAELGGDLWARLPLPVNAVVAAARAAADGTAKCVPEVRARSVTGEWLVLRAAPIRDRDGLTSQVAVTVETAAAAKIVPLLVAAHGFTERECEVVQHVLRGSSTNEIAAALHLSPYTVQDHLKTIFDKAGVTSRGSLTAQIFFTHYAGRLDTDFDARGWFAD